MSARRNRLVLIMFGSLLIAVGGLAVAVGGGTFGQTRAHHAVIDTAVIRWWNEGGWESFAVVAVIGVALLLIGAWLMVGQLRIPGTNRTATIVFPVDGRPGETQLRPSALRHAIEADLGALPGVIHVSAQLAGSYPSVGLRTHLTVTDDSQLDDLQHQLAGPLSRVQTTTGIRLSPITILVRFAAQDQERQLA